MFLGCLVYALFGLASARAADLVLVHARVYASPGAAPIDDATIVLRDGLIASVGRAGRVPKGAEVLDCTGMSVTAGLWNSHVHILPVKFLHADQKTGADLTAAFREMLTGWGFTTVFDVGSVLANTNNLRTRIAAGEILGPRILTTGEPFFPRNGVPVYVRGYLDENHITMPDDASTEAAVKRVRQQVHDGADAIKIFAGSIQADSVLMMPLERAQAIVKEAHSLHRQVFEHPTNLAGVEIALKSGVDVLAHVTSQEGEDWSPELVARMRAQKMAVIPTLTLFDVEAKKGGIFGGGGTEVCGYRGEQAARVQRGWRRDTFRNGCGVYLPVRYGGGVHADAAGGDELRADSGGADDESGTAIRLWRPERTRGREDGRRSDGLQGRSGKRHHGVLSGTLYDSWREGDLRRCSGGGSLGGGELLADAGAGAGGDDAGQRRG